MSLVYIDVLRIVSPLEKLNEDLYNFYLLGGFDAMEVNLTIDSLRGLQDKQRERHAQVPIRYDRQPLYLYSNETRENLESKIFSRSGKYSHRPLVMTLFQLDNHKNVLTQESPVLLMKSLHDCVEKELGNVFPDGNPDIEFHVFLCMGESDCVVIFRGDKITDIGKLVFRLRSLQAIPQGIRILSTCSHCAFPRTRNVQSDFKEWLKNDSEVRLVTMLNTSYGLRDIGKIENLNKFLFGEWDYWVNWKAGVQNKEENAKFYVDRITSYLKGYNPSEPGAFRTAYTVPVVRLSDEEKGINVGSKQTLDDINYITQASEWIEGIEPNKDSKLGNNPFRQLENTINGLTELYGAGGKHLAKTVVSLGGTITGLAKHLYRLLCGRFEQDLYAFVKPVFDDLLVVTEDITDKVDKLYTAYVDETEDEDRKKEYSDRIGLLLDNYVHDTSELLSQLQHLFSVLSVSPHTYLETYGSNMRSLAATCKLVVAYQGITYCLGQIFSENLVDEAGISYRIHYTTLVLPYRNITTNNCLLFSQSSLKKRLSYIQIDFTEMFDIPNALFVLLHECGHQFIESSMRKKCAESYVRAVVENLFHQALSFNYQDIGRTVSWPLRREGHVFSMSNDVTQSSIDNIRARFFENCEAICKGYWDYYEDYCAEMNEIFDPLALENMVLPVIHESLKSYLSELTEKGEDGWDGLFVVFQRLFRTSYTIVNHVIQEIEEFNEKGASLRRGDDGRRSMELRDAIFLEQFYCVPEPSNPKDGPSHVPDAVRMRIKKYMELVRQQFLLNLTEVCDELSEVYGDIYSDLFAINLLSLGCQENAEDQMTRAQEYVELIIRMAGAIRNEVVLETGKLLRIRAVLNECYHIEETQEITHILQGIGMPERICQKAEILLDEIKNSLYYDEITKFAKTCQDELNEKRKDSNLETVSQRLKQMHSNQSDSVIDSIYYFWKISTQREEEAQSA